MDPYDAILEQLTKAQQQAAESVAKHFNSILDSLETALAETRRAVDEAGAAGAGELVPVVGIEEAVDAARARLEAIEERAGHMVSRIEELETQVRDLEDRPPAATGLSLDVLRRLDRARSQSELLRELLGLLREHVGRAAVLVVRESTVSAWSGVGFSSEERLRSWQAALGDSPVLQAVIETAQPTRLHPAADPVWRRWLEGEGMSDEAVLVPVSLRGRVVGAIYADRRSDRPLDTEVVQAAVAVACWLIDTLSVRQTVPSPMVAEIDDRWEAAPEPESERDAFGMGEPTPPHGLPALRDADVAAAAAPAGEALERDEPEMRDTVQEPDDAAGELAETDQEPAVERVVPAEGAEEPSGVGGYELDTGEEDTAVHFDPSATVQLTSGRFAGVEDVDEDDEDQLAEAEHTGAPESEPAPDELAAEPDVPAPAAASVESYEVTPPPVRPVTPPPPAPAAMPAEGDRSPEEQAQHDEARRFARLLVSEIKLYNEDEVELGRRNFDLYQRLKEDVDRSREMYEKRIPETVRSERDYFREELVRILADGDADALGM